MASRTSRAVAHAGDPAAPWAGSRRSMAAHFRKSAVEEHHDEFGGNFPERHMRVMPLDAQAMKDKFKTDCDKPVYCVKNFYKEEGLCQRVARSDIFDNTTLAVISVNALWISLESDLNTNGEVLIESHPVFIIGENFFCIYFLVELIFRFGAFANKRNCLKDYWFVFDSFMVALMVFETWVMMIVYVAIGGTSGGGLGDAAMLRMLRLLRLSRMARMARLLRHMPEIVILIKGMVAALRSVGFTLVLLILLLYVFAIAFKMLADGTPTGEEWFTTVPRSANMLVIYAIFADNLGDVAWSCVAEENKFLGVVMWILLFTFILLAQMTVMNMLIGVLCQMVVAVGEAEREELTINFLKESLWPLCEQFLLPEQKPEEMKITQADFVELLQNSDMTKTLHDIEVDMNSLVDLTETIFADEKGQEKCLNFGDLVAALLSLRATSQATVKDLTDVRRFFDEAMDDQDDEMAQRILGMQASIEALSTLVEKVGNIEPGTVKKGAERRMKKAKMVMNNLMGQDEVRRDVAQQLSDKSKWKCMKQKMKGGEVLEQVTTTEGEEKREGLPPLKEAAETLSPAQVTFSTAGENMAAAPELTSPMTARRSVEVAASQTGEQANKKAGVTSLGLKSSGKAAKSKTAEKEKLVEVGETVELMSETKTRSKAASKSPTATPGKGQGGPTRRKSQMSNASKVTTNSKFKRVETGGN